MAYVKTLNYEPGPDRQVVCDDCDDTFEWTAGEQEYYFDRGLNMPKRCKPCRKSRKKKFARSGK